MGYGINIFIDNLLLTTWRLLDLPLYFLILLLFLATLSSIILFYFIKKRTRYKDLKSKKPGIIIVCLLLFFVALLVDYKYMLMEKELNAVHEKCVELYFHTKSFQAKEEINKKKGMFSPQPLCDYRNLKNIFPASLEINERYLNRAIQLLSIKKENPRAQVFVAVVDLENKGVEIVITPEFKKKGLTSVFARANGCDVAINGEAGKSRHDKCGLGEYTGNWIVNGRPVLLQDSERRPFLSFDRHNHAKYFKESIIDRVYTPEKYNTIWGRYDMLVNGKRRYTNSNEPYSRTMMGINSAGNRLYLLVADGKRPDYSLGLTYGEAALMLKLLGADDAMACDQGGSSCMYIKDIDGIINRPADPGGEERKVYTHFGVKVR